MKRVYLLGGILTVASLSALAAPTCSTTPGSNNLIAYTGSGNVGGSLPNGLNALTAGLTGTQDNPCTPTGSSLTFSNFSYDVTNGGFTTSSPTINLILASASGGTTAFDFNPNLGSNSDLEFEFEVTGGVQAITLSLNSASGFVNETVCTKFTPDGNCADGGGTQIGTTIGVTPASPNASVNLGGTYQNIWIFKDINVGSAGGLSEVNQGFLTPEPLTFSLVGAGLLGLGLLRRRSNR
jgi:hypothetical protein